MRLHTCQQSWFWSWLKNKNRGGKPLSQLTVFRTGRWRTRVKLPAVKAEGLTESLKASCTWAETMERPRTTDDVFISIKAETETCSSLVTRLEMPETPETWETSEIPKALKTQEISETLETWSVHRGKCHGVFVVSTQTQVSPKLNPTRWRQQVTGVCVGGGVSCPYQPFHTNTWSIWIMNLIVLQSVYKKPPTPPTTTNK